MTLQASVYRNTITLKFPYRKSLVAEIKDSLPGAQFDSKNKAWKVDGRMAPQVINMLKRHKSDIPDKLQELADTAGELADVEYYQKGLRIHKTVSAGFPQDIEHDKRGAWLLVPAQHMNSALSWARERSLKIDPDAVRAAQGQFLREIGNRNRATSIEASPQEITGLTSTPMPEQWVPVSAIRENKKILLADEQGLGKTLEALMSARVKGKESQRLLILCPDSLTRNWISEMQLHFTEKTFNPIIAKSKTPEMPSSDFDSIIIGWSILADWSETLKKWNPDMIIADEGHYAKSGKATKKTEEVVSLDENNNVKVEKVTRKVGGSYRSSAFISLLTQLKDEDSAIILTGTPIPNRPQELLPLLQALQLEGYFGGSFLFQKRYCGGTQKYIGAGRGIRGSGYVWDFSGASNLIELNDRLLASGQYIRRTKEHLVESGRLPSKTVDGVDYYDLKTPSAPTFVEGDPEVMKEYNQKTDEFADTLYQSVVDFAKAGNFGLGTQKVKKKIASEGNKQKQNLFQLRRLAGLAAVPGISKAIKKDYLDKGEKVVVVAHHLDVIEAYMKEFPNSVKIQGGMGSTKIEEAKAKFNSSGFEHPVMILGIEAGKTGHTLCKQPDKKCANIIFAEMPWNPGDSAQAQDRIWRLGQDREVNVTHMLVKGTVNEDIYHMCKRKRLIVDAVVDSREATTDDVSDKAMISELSMLIFEREGKSRKRGAR